MSLKIGHIPPVVSHLVLFLLGFFIARLSSHKTPAKGLPIFAGPQDVVIGLPAHLIESTGNPQQPGSSWENLLWEGQGCLLPVESVQRLREQVLMTARRQDLPWFADVITSAAKPLTWTTEHAPRCITQTVVKYGER